MTEIVGDLEFGDDYELRWRREPDDVVGEVCNTATDGFHTRHVPIVLDDAELERAGFRLLAQEYDGGKPSIVVSSTFMSLPENLREAAIWHEMGHVHHLHRFREPIRDQAQRREDRLRAIEADDVVQEEKEADGFAVSRVGVQRVVDFLRYTLSTRPRGAGLNDIGRRELELRLARLLRTGRNDPCPCGSARKYKHCCLEASRDDFHRR